MNDVRSWQAPGRVTLLGEHLDYNGGTALGVALDRGITLKARARDDTRVRVWSTGEQRRHGELDITDSTGEGWLAYVAGVLAELREIGLRTGADLVIESSLPEGAGLASSAALTSVLVHALAELNGLPHDSAFVVDAVHRVENDQLGIPTGFLDQTVVAYAEDGQVLHLDFTDSPPQRALLTAAFAEAGVTLVLIDTRTRRTLADGRYADRRRECEATRTALGLDRLAEVSLDKVVLLEDETLKRRARHVLTETARVRSARQLIADGRFDRFGPLLTASHESLRDDFEVSCAQLDVAVETALEAGALGAKLTGAGFAGCVVALAPVAELSRIKELVEAQFENAGWAAPGIVATRPSVGLTEGT